MGFQCVQVDRVGYPLHGSGAPAGASAVDFWGQIVLGEEGREESGVVPGFRDSLQVVPTDFEREPEEDCSCQGMVEADRACSECREARRRRSCSLLTVL